MNQTDYIRLHGLPLKGELAELLHKTIVCLDAEPENLRPRDSSGKTGGLLRIGTFFTPPLPVVLVPDLHARTDFFTEILNFSLPPDFVYDILPLDKLKLHSPLTIKDALQNQLLFVICLGDGFHGERRVKERWLRARDEWFAGNIQSDAMANEMKESLSLMMMVMQTKCTHPNHFHFIKGNHENILNELGRGNYPFGKFTLEGEMVKQFVSTVYGKTIIEQYAEFEHRLPIFVKGFNFLASHAEPLMPFFEQDLIEGLLDEGVVTGLTWTNRGLAETGSVGQMLDTLLPDVPHALYFGGHRSISGTYRLLQGGRYVQLHNPENHMISIVHPERPFNPLCDIYDTRPQQGGSFYG